MLALILVALIIWLVLAVLGFVVHGLVWLAIIGVVLFVATAVYGSVKRSALRR